MFQSQVKEVTLQNEGGPHFNQLKNLKSKTGGFPEEKELCLKAVHRNFACFSHLLACHFINFRLAKCFLLLVFLSRILTNVVALDGY